MKRLTEEEIDRITLFVLAFWLFLLLPWFIFAPLSGMAFDAGPRPSAYVFVWSILTYPVSVGVVWKFRKRVPLIALLPSANIAIWLISGLNT